MRVREAKDFLVAEIKKQAEIDAVSLAEPEIEMLYFTEQDGLSAKMQELVDNFDANYDMAAYEKKISGLMKHAYKRLKKENTPYKATWDAAIRCLKKGDHYILVMWGGISGLSLLLVLGMVLAGIATFSGFSWLGHKFQPPDPRVLQIAFVGLVVFGYLLRRQLANAVGVLVEKTLGRWLESRGEKSDL